MRTLPLIGIAWRALVQHKLRSLLSTLGIVFGVLAVVAMLAIAEGARREAVEQIRELGTHTVIIRPALLTEAQRRQARRHLSRGLTHDDVGALLTGVPGVSCVAPSRDLRAHTDAATAESLAVLAVTPSSPGSVCVSSCGD